MSPRIGCAGLSLAVMTLSGALLDAQSGGRAAALAEQIETWNQDLSATFSEAARPLSLQSGYFQRRSSIVQRAAALKELVRLDAAAALKVTLSQQQLIQLRSTYPELTGELEVRGEWQGRMEHLIADDFGSGESWPVYLLRLDEGSVEASFAANTPPGLGTGDLIRVEGLRIGARMAVSDAAVVAAADEAAACSATGEQRVAVLMVNYSGDPAPNVTPEQVRAAFFSKSAPSLDGYWREVSYGKTYATGDVFGWFTISESYGNQPDTPTLREAAIAAADGQVDFTKYNRLFIITPSWTGGCGPACATTQCASLLSPADGSFAASTTWMTTQGWGRDGKLYTILHEGGHNLGLFHASTAEFGDVTLGHGGETGRYDEYGDRFSTMGSGSGHYSARHKLQLGWLTEGTEVETVEGSGTFDLRPLSSAGSGRKALRVRRSTQNDSWFWMEYRQPVGPYEPPGYSLSFSGALIYYEDSYTRFLPRLNLRTHMLDFTPQTQRTDILSLPGFDDARLAVGETWQDLFSNRTIEVVSETREGLTVSVRQDPTCANMVLKSRDHGPEAVTGVIEVSAPPDCSWTVTAPSPCCAWDVTPPSAWIKVTSAPEGKGSGLVSYSLDANNQEQVRTGAISVGRKPFVIRQHGILTQGSAPSIGAVLNGASFDYGISSAGWVAIFGVNLSHTTRMWAGTDFSGNKLPTSLDGVSVLIGGHSAYMYFISPGQLNVLVPDSVGIGPIEVRVKTPQGTSAAFSTMTQVMSPGFFTFDPEDRRYIAAVHLDGAYLGKPGLYAGLNFRAAKPGDVVMLFGTGFGPVSPETPSDQLVTQPGRLTSPAVVRIGGVQADVQWAGLVSPGLYQFNVLVPNVPDGDQAVVAEIGGVTSQAGAFITVRR